MWDYLVVNNMQEKWNRICIFSLFSISSFFFIGLFNLSNLFQSYFIIRSFQYLFLFTLLHFHQILSFHSSSKSSSFIIPPPSLIFYSILSLFQNDPSSKLLHHIEQEMWIVSLLQMPVISGINQYLLIAIYFFFMIEHYSYSYSVMINMMIINYLNVNVTDFYSLYSIFFLLYCLYHHY